MAVLVIVPASFAPVAMYDEWVAHLAEHGVRAVVVDLPSVGPREGLPPQTMTDDANEISKVAGELLDSGEDVVLLTHSYGGIPGTQSLEKVSHKARQAVGKSGVKTIVYMTSVVVPVGVSTFEAFQSNLPDGVTLEGKTMALDVATAGRRTFSALPEDQALVYAKKMTTHSVLSFQERLQYPGYNDVEVHYVLCENDEIIPPELQQGMIEMIKTTSGREPTVHKVKGDHVPDISQRDMMTNIVKGIVA